jgi:4-amino-4-deoxy-L-arabinose transferase-like glycosyltransferase
MTATVALRRAVATPNAAVGRAVALAAVVVLAGQLRLSGLGQVPLNSYYDAAVRSMGTSWHAFLVGAFDPNVTVATDKPPIDLWLQVASTKLFGFTPFALHLPEAIASTAAVLILYDLVRRGFGATAGLSAAVALAVLPVEVLTARSDTMDGVMMALLVLAAWLLVRGAERGRTRELYAAAVVVGLAFETKLFEALIAVPALVALFLITSRGSRPRRVAHLFGAAVAMAAVGLAWPALFAVTQSHGHPFPIGSADGGIWSTIFGFNGVGRLSAASTRAIVDPARLATELSLDRLVGVALLAAIAFAAAAALLTRKPWRRRPAVPAGIAVAAVVWLAVGVGVLTHMQTLRARYLEVIAVPLAAVLGIGVALTARAAVRRALAAAGAPVAAGVAGLVVLLAAAVSLAHARGTAIGVPAVALVAMAGLASVLVLAITVGRRYPRTRQPENLLAIGVTALALLAVLANPTAESLELVRTHASDGGSPGAMRAQQLTQLSRYLTAHRGHARYEFASLTAPLAGPLIANDGQPVMVLGGYTEGALVPTSALSRAVRVGELRYVLASHGGPARHGCRHHRTLKTVPSLQPALAWVLRHGVDITPSTGLLECNVLFRVYPAALR